MSQDLHSLVFHNLWKSAPQGSSFLESSRLLPLLWPKATLSAAVTPFTTTTSEPSAFSIAFICETSVYMLDDEGELQKGVTTLPDYRGSE